MSVVKRVVDDKLGPIVFDEDVGAWTAAVTIDGEPLEFNIGGDTTPNPVLVAHARAIAASADAFRSKVRELLVAESKRVGDGRASEEILALEIENVCLWESGPPVTGMIYFLGGDDDRVWRCDYEDGEPKDLGFDS